MDAALLATADGRILAANPAACRMFGMPEAELVMVGRYGLVDLSDPRLKPAMEERNRTGRFYGELTFIRRDGTKFEGEIASVIIPTQTGEDRASVVIRDITERKRVEAALAKSRNLLLETEKIGNVGGWEFDIDTKQQVWTEEVHRIHEVDLTYKPTVEKGINFYTPESRSVIERAVQRAIEYGEPFDVKLEIITAKGNRRWVHAIGRADLKHRRVFGFFQDIHDRKRAEEALKTLNETLEQRVAERTAALQQRETELTEAQRVAHVGNWMWDIETGHVTWSDELYRIFDRDPKQFTPHIRDYPQILTAESCARRSTAAQRTIETGAPYELDLEIIRPDGERRWIVSHGEAVRDTSGRVVRLRGTAQDITDRKRAEESLRKSEERYHSLVDNLNVGVYRSTVESGGRLIQANPAMARMLSFESVNALMNVSVADIYQNPADRQTYLADLLCIGFVTGYELRLKKKDGTPIYCSVTAAAHRGPNGKVEWVDGILEDITERKRLEDQLIEISEREQRRIGQDLHDGLCQHLAGVGFMSKALAQKLAHNAPTEASDAQTVANLIRQAISEARGIATGLHPVKKEPNATMVALQELAANIESMFRVHCTFTCDPPILIEDNNVATHVYRIAQEAVNNALRHGKARNIWITLAGKNHRITLTVKDDGKGIPQPLPAGRGIGIDIMTHRARVIGGTFHIGRTPEGGTILTCSFPNLPAT
jgi:PAS domain S-box-containing protein